MCRVKINLLSVVNNYGTNHPPYQRALEGINKVTSGTHTNTMTETQTKCKH